MWLAACLALMLAGPSLAADENDRTISDGAITDAVESRLDRAKGVSGNRIDTDTSNGIVTLSGEVDNVLAEERAVRIAESIKGVRAVVEQINVSGPTKSDAKLRLDVVTALATDPATDSWEIDVKADDGTITLGGEVDSWQEKQLAATVAKGVSGVRELHNNIRVDADYSRSDNEIAAEIKQRLMWDVRIRDGLIDVNVENGKAILSGSVGSAFEKSLARSLAWVTGVRSVETSDLNVAWWARDEMLRKERFADVSDDEIRQAVRDALLYDPRVMSFNPIIDVEYGVVTLRGTVHDLKAKRAAAADAANTVGVRRVRNFLKVRPLGPPADAALKTDVRAALERDPYVDRYEIRISSINGEVTLYGTVDSYFEKWQAGDVAAKVPGVVEVNNHLNVSAESPDYDFELYDWNPITQDFDYEPESTAAREPDWQIEMDIESQLWWSPFVDADEVKVEVDNGIATLTGTVDSWSERNAATENAYEGGAIYVDNDLKVDYMESESKSASTADSG